MLWSFLDKMCCPPPFLSKVGCPNPKLRAPPHSGCFWHLLEQMDSDLDLIFLPWIGLDFGSNNLYGFGFGFEFSNWFESESENPNPCSSTLQPYLLSLHFLVSLKMSQLKLKSNSSSYLISGIHPLYNSSSDYSLRGDPSVSKG